jgi:hypothetical protein
MVHPAEDIGFVLGATPVIDLLREPTSLQVEPGYTQEQYDVVLM